MASLPWGVSVLECGELWRLGERIAKHAAGSELEMLTVEFWLCY